MFGVVVPCLPAHSRNDHPRSAIHLMSKQQQAGSSFLVTGLFLFYLLEQLIYAAAFIRHLGQNSSVQADLNLHSATDYNTLGGTRRAH